MNKKGFTLVELLAVIAILAILLLLVLPNILNLFNNAKKDSFLNELKGLYNSAESKWMNESLSNTKEVEYAGSLSEVCENHLDLTGRKELEYFITLNKQGEIVKFYATDNTYQFEHNGKLLIEQITDAEEVSVIPNTEKLTITCNSPLKNGKSVLYGELCITNGKTVDADKEYYTYEIGSSVSGWGKSKYNTIGISLEGFVDNDGTYTRVNGEDDLRESEEGCYYPAMVHVCILPNMTTDIERFFNIYEVPKGIKKSLYANSIFYGGDIPTDRFIKVNGIMHNNPSAMDYIAGNNEGCYMREERPPLGSTINVTLNGSRYTCNQYQTVGECLGGSNPTRTYYYGRIHVTYGSMYAVSSMAAVEAGEQYSLSGGVVCLDGESLVDVYDKKKKKKLKKKLKDITYDDLIMAWDFDIGKVTYSKPVWIMNQKSATEVLNLKFSDGSILRVPGGLADHRIYNLDLEKFTSCRSDVDTPLGMKTINASGEIITLTSKEITNEYITICNAITYKDINLYANNILTSRGSNNLYKIKDMKFVKDDRETLSREDLPYVSDEMFYGLRLGERDIKVYGSKEKAINELNKFVNELECDKVKRV